MMILLKFGFFSFFTVPALALIEATLLQEIASPQGLQGPTASSSSDDSDSLVLPDATPILIRVVKGFSSENAKVGDVVNFAVAFDVREGGLVMIPQRTGFTGKVVFVDRPHRGARNGRVNVAFDALTLPTGETATVRSIKKPANKAAKVEEGATTAVGTAAELFITAGVPLFVLFKRGDEEVIPEGTLERVYLNGPLRLSRKGVMALQPTPASGYANVFVSLQSLPASVFCGERDVRPSLPGHLPTGFYWSMMRLRLQLRPGSYWFSTDYQKDRPVRIEVLAGHEYSVGRKNKELVAKELPPRSDRYYQKPGRDNPWVIVDEDLTNLTPEEYSSLTAEPAARRSESGTQHE
jgi:hypothetical protein